MFRRFWFVLPFFLIACSDTTQNPPTFIPGKRNYTWTSDTLFYLGNAQTAMQSIFGSGPDNVYIVGHCEVSAGRIWRYDGARWQTVDLSLIRGYLNAIAGSGEDNIWIAGGQAFYDSTTMGYVDSTLLVHFDGAQWRQVEVERRGGLYCIDVLSNRNVWAGGTGGVLYRFNGSTWELHEVGRQYFFSSIAAVSSSEAYAMGHVSDSAPPIDSAGSFLFRYDGNGWGKIDSVMNTPGAPPAHIGTGVYTWSGVLYTIGSDIFRRSGGQWVRLTNAQVGHMSQSSAVNIVAVGRGVWHFNGIDWIELENLSSVFGYDCYTDGQEIYIVGNDNWRTFIHHGK